MEQFDDNKEKEKLDKKKTIIKQVKKNRTEGFSAIFKILKQHIFALIIILSSISNFSYVNFVFTILGIVIAILALIKLTEAINLLRIIYIFIISLAFTNLFFKIVIMTLYLTKLESTAGFLEDYKELLNDLGVKFMIKNSAETWVNAFIGDLAIIVSYFSLLIFKHKNTNVNKSDIKFFLHKTKKKEIYMTFIIIILIAGSNSSNFSFLSLLYGLVFILILLFWIFNSLRKLLRVMSYFLLVLSCYHLLIYHFINIYSFRKSAFVDDNLFKWMGVVEMSARVRVSTF